MHHRYIFLALTILFLTALPASSIDYGKTIIFDMPRDQIESYFGRGVSSELTRDDSLAMATNVFEGDTLRLLAILVDWRNREATYSLETFDSLLFSRGVYPGGSVADFYYEASYGKVTIVGDAIDWYEDGMYEGYMDFEGILDALDPVIDFSQYDGDNDGNVDACVFVRAGTGQEDSHDPQDIWSFAMIYPLGSGLGPYDGMMLPRFNTSPELWPERVTGNPTLYSGTDTLNGIRVFAHELFHNLGHADLYDYDDKLVTSTYYTPNDNNDHPFVDWDVMGYGGYGIFSLGGRRNPTHFCGFHKMKATWLEPTILMGEHFDIVIENLETSDINSLYMLPINPSEGEYFLLEYRNPKSAGMYDKLDSDFSCYFWPDLTYGADTLDRGLLITHIDDSVSQWSNNGTPDMPNYRARVIDAGYNPAMDHTFNPEGHVTDSAQWWYPYETRKGALFSSETPLQNEFSPTTDPSSDGYGGPTGITVIVDSIVGDKLYAYVYNPNFFDEDSDGVDDFTDNCISTPNADQLDDDGDGFGNACDNCPSLANEGQEDLDGDNIGDICDVCPNDEFNDQDGDGLCADVDPCPLDEFNDQDSDGFCADVDNCPTVANPTQADTDGDSVGDACCCTERGDVDNNGSLDVSDLTYYVDYLFGGGPGFVCPEHGDIDYNGAQDISDLTFYVEYMFGGGATPPACPTY